MDQAYAVNRDGSAHLASACSDAGIPLLHISTDYVFDGTAPHSYTELDPVKPISVYGASKQAGEAAVRNHLDRHIILRTSWVFAKHGSNFVKTMLRVGQGGGPLKVVDDQFGGPTSARAIAKALLMMADRFEQHGDLRGHLSFQSRTALQLASVCQPHLGHGIRGRRG